MSLRSSRGGRRQRKFLPEHKDANADEARSYESEDFRRLCDGTSQRPVALARGGRSRPGTRTPVGRQASHLRLQPECEFVSRGQAAAPTRSTMVALAMPPPSHIVCRPKRAPDRIIWWVRVVISLAPDAPIGCPSAIAPPLTLS